MRSKSFKEVKINFNIRSLKTLFAIIIMLAMGAAILAANPQPSDAQKVRKQKIRKYKIKKKRFDLRKKTAKLYKMMKRKKLKDGKLLMFTTKNGIKCFRIIKDGQITKLVFFNNAGKKLRARIIPGIQEEEDVGAEQMEPGEGEGWIDCGEGTHSVTIIVCDEDEYGNEIPESCVEITDCVPD
jgi:hypothetical protein